MSERERTLRSLAGVEGLWARTCAKVAKKFNKAGNIERFREWNKKRLDALAKRNDYLAQAEEVHHRG